MAETTTPAEALGKRRHEALSKGMEVHTAWLDGKPLTQELRESLMDSLDGLREISKLALACPVCPECKEPLVARLPARRFMEDDHYAECPNGHVWHLEQEG